MKFDMSAAWNEAARLLAANRQVITVLTGVFFFLPYLAFTLAFMTEAAALESLQAAKPDPESIGDATMGYYRSIWWAIVLLVVIQAVGVLGVLALLTDRSRPTVGEALKSGARLMLPYLGVQILVMLQVVLLISIPIAIAGGGTILGGLLFGIFAAILIAYLFTKYLLAPPVIVVERETNPIAAMRRSWRLTSGNTLRVFAFVLLLIVAIAVVGAVISMIFGLLFAIAGAQAALIGQAIVASLLNAVFYAVFLAVLAATYRQLAGSPVERDAKAPD